MFYSNKTYRLFIIFTRREGRFQGSARGSWMDRPCGERGKKLTDVDMTQAMMWARSELWGESDPEFISVQLRDGGTILDRRDGTIEEWE